MSHNNSIGNYLIQRLLELGVNPVFGVPGDFVLGFNKGQGLQPMLMLVYEG